MEKAFITYKQSTLAYYKYGQGKKWLFCFHGYGETGETFAFLEPHLGADYTLLALDLPFHGATEWNEGLLFTSSDLWSIINQITESLHQHISLTGYSMGGRVALKLLSDNINRIDKVALIAPDGLHGNIWHWLATQTLLGNQLFGFTMKHPNWFFKLMQLSSTLKLINKSIFNFAHYYLDDSNQRMDLYSRWTTMRKFKLNLYLLRKNIHNNRKKVVLFFGKHDRIILTSKGKKFQRGLQDFIVINELEAGHQLLKEKYAAEIAAAFRF